MKKVIVKEGEIGLLFKNEQLQKVLKSGNYWLMFGEKYFKYLIKESFNTSFDLDILMKNKELQSALNVIDVKDDEAYLKYVKGVYKNTLVGGTYAYWKDNKEIELTHIDLTKAQITEKVSKSVLDKLSLTGIVRKHVVGVGEVGLLFIDGEFTEQLSSGTHYFWKNEQTILAKNIDVRKQRLELNGQEILTQDKANLRLNLEAVYQVIDTQKAVLEAKEYERQLYTILQMAARTVVGGLTFDELMTKKEALNKELLEFVISKVAVLGLEITDFGIKDIILPGEMKEIMNQVLVAQKRAQANVITRREETSSTRSMLNTAKLMEENPMLFKLKEMEYVEKIAERIDNISVSGGGKVMEQLKGIFT